MSSKVNTTVPLHPDVGPLIPDVWQKVDIVLHNKSCCRNIKQSNVNAEKKRSTNWHERGKNKYYKVVVDSDSISKWSSCPTPQLMTKEDLIRSYTSLLYDTMILL